VIFGEFDFFLNRVLLKKNYNFFQNGKFSSQKIHAFNDAMKKIGELYFQLETK
jgi:hypothetical protein